MKKTTCSLLGIIALFLNYSLLHAQNLNTPAEIFKILDESKISYEIGTLDKKIEVPNRDNNLVFNDFYLDDNTLQIYDLNDKAKALFNEAEDYFHQKKYEQARKKYLATLEEAPKFYKAMTYIGQTYGQEGNDKDAIEWYQKTISKNPIDYMAHWFLADAYYQIGRFDLAVEEITIAQIFNRNNPRIKLSFNRIYAKKKLQTKEWTFNPQVKVDSTGANKVSIVTDKLWMGYGLAKAVWKYEPGYSESKGVAVGTASTLEERECLLGLFYTLKKKDIKSDLSFKAFELALEKKYADEYILYEILLVNYPKAACLLPDKTIARLKKYVIEVRGQLK